MRPSPDVTVSFSAGPDKEGPSSWAQTKTYRRRAKYPGDRNSAFLTQITELPPESDIPRVVAALRSLLVAHESLRTLYPDVDGLRQRVVGEGELPVRVHDAPDDGTTLSNVLESMTERPFDFARELPLRVAVVAPHGTPRKLVVVHSHIAVDGEALRILGEDLENALAGVSGPLPSGAAHQPLDVGTEQQSAAWQERNEAALRHWGRALARVPQSVLAVPAGTRPDSSPRYLCGVLRSRTAADALQVLAARTKASRSAVLLAATAAVLAHRAGNDRCALTSIAANRNTPHTERYVGTIAQDALVVLTAGSGTFDALVRRAWAGSLAAYQHSQVDPLRLWDLIDRIGFRRGIRFARDCVYNDRSGSGDAAPVPEGAGRTGLLVDPATFMPVRFYFKVVRSVGVAEFSLWTDSHYLPEPDLRAFLTGVESLLVAAADEDLPLERVGAVSGIVPVVRGPEWVEIDSSLIDLAATGNLVEKAAGGRTSAVLPVVPESAGAPELVAYVDAGGASLTPHALHTACVAALSEFDGAMAPARYVLCDGAPAEPAAAEQWLGRPVLRSGDGREPAA
ncbi:condensation domain-containing protein [Streptomyces sp. NPDC004647]|uniref:condensation domain-containing protein n=1 Tax=Streptomyces sp. NPDC004647 TaxID=3154671 RepID=UPI0033ADC9B8